MSSIWTPGGEHPVGDDEPFYDDEEDPDVDPDLVEEVEARMAEARRQILETPARRVVTNHVMGLYELAAIHLSNQPPSLDEARLAIDAMGILVEGLGGRLEEERTLTDALAQLRMAFVQVKAASGYPDEEEDSD
jgi:Domain of unknown function (DUF1844)